MPDQMENQSSQNQPEINWATLTATGLAAAKITAEAFGMPFISNQQIDAVVNLIAVGGTIFGILFNHIKK